MAENKIYYGVKNVYYAKATIAADGSATYETPVALPGAVSITMDPEGGQENFYADNKIYYVSSANNGYTGSLELAEIPDAFAKDILGETVDEKGIITEHMNVEPVHFALLFQFEGDQRATRHAFYNVVAARPSVASNTKEDTVTPGTKTLNLTATGVYVAAVNDDVTKSRTSETTPEADYNGWFTSVILPGVPVV